MSEVQTPPEVEKSIPNKEGRFASLTNVAKRIGRVVQRPFRGKEASLPEETIGGIPKRLFESEKDITEVITTPEGRKLECTFTQDKISIHDVDNEDYHFSAYVKPGENDVKELSFSVSPSNSRRFDAEEDFRHPNIYPAQLLSESISYFDKKDSEPVKRLSGYWYEGYYGGKSSNHQEYHANLTALGKRPEDITNEDRQQAALNTWTGRQAVAHGFTSVKEIDDKVNGNSVAVAFERPEGYILAQRAKSGEKVI